VWDEAAPRACIVVCLETDKLAMKAICLGIMLATALAASAAGAEIHPRGKGYGASTPPRPPLALRTLSKHSVAVLASDACWRPCTAHCGFHFQQCLKVGWQDGCFAANNECELDCLKHCRLSGGPLVSWTDW
jgi:hypothetical protein